MVYVSICIGLPGLLLLMLLNTVWSLGFFDCGLFQGLFQGLEPTPSQITKREIL
jgi:hypothetical protein